MRRPGQFPVTTPLIKPAFNGGAPLDSDDILNNSGVVGANVSNALNTLDADKADKSTTITAGDKEVTGQHETTS